MARIKKEELHGVLKSKDENRYKYVLSHLCNGSIAHFSDCPNSLIELNNSNTSKKHIVLWSDKVFIDEFLKVNSNIKLKIEKVRLHKFYRETLTSFIKQDINLLIFPNVNGNGKIMTAKEFKIAMFKEIWEGWQEEWVFN